MGRREREGKTAKGLCGKPVRSLARDMGGMVVENDLDRGVGGVSGIEELEKLDEFAAAMAFLDQGMDVTGEQIDPRHRGQGTVALVFVIAHHGPADAGEWRLLQSLVNFLLLPEDLYLTDVLNLLPNHLFLIVSTSRFSRDYPDL